jgi:uncharacterized membrane protein
MSEILELMTDDGKPPAAAAIAEPAVPRKRGRPPKTKPAVDAPAEATPTTRKDVRPQGTETPDTTGSPRETAPQVAQPHEPTEPRRVHTTRKSRPNPAPRTASGSAARSGDNTSTVVLVALGGLLALGAIYLLRSANGAPNAPPAGAVVDDITRAWNELGSQIQDVSDKLTLRLGQR